MKSITFVLLGVLLTRRCSSSGNLHHRRASRLHRRAPYSQISTSPETISDPQGNDQYIITYANPDGCKAVALPTAPAAKPNPTNSTCPIAH